MRPLAKELSPVAARFGVKQATVKTITFRPIATTLDVTTNDVVIGSFVTAVGLSAVGFVVGPHRLSRSRKAWDYHSHRQDRLKAAREIRFDARMLTRSRNRHWRA